MKRRTAVVLFSCLAVASGMVLLAQNNPQFPSPPASSPAGPLAYSCGVPATPPTAPPSGRGQLQPTFPSGQYPVKLPPVSMLGARNDLPNPYQAGVDFGQLPPAR